MVFTVSDKLVRERYGAEFDLSKWVEGVDYVRRKAFRGERVVFRKGFLGEEKASDAEEKQKAATSIMEPVVSGNNGVIQCDAGAQEALQHKVNFGGSGVYSCKVIKLYANQRYVGTDKGVVYVGGKSVKRGETLMAADAIMLKKIK